MWVCVTCVFGFVACGKKGESGLFSAAKVSQIELGMSKQEVGDILGKPDASNKRKYIYGQYEVYYWYEEKAKNLFAEIEKAEKEIGKEDEFDKFGNENDNLEQLYMQLEKMSYKVIMVNFSDYDGKVAGVYLDCEHKYNETSDFVSAKEKTAIRANVEVEDLIVDTIAVHTISTTGITTSEEPLCPAYVLSVVYNVHFSDGSFIRGMIDPKPVGLTDDMKKVKLEWSDEIGSYTAEAPLHMEKQGDKIKIVFAEGMTRITAKQIPLMEGTVVSISLPSTLTAVESDMFDDYGNLQYAQKDGLKYLGNENNPYVYLAGVETKGITVVAIEEDCKIIGYEAFNDCFYLAEITIPNTVISIGKDAFYTCRRLKTIKFNGTVAQWNAIEKDSGWNAYISATMVECSDGEVKL